MHRARCTPPTPAPDPQAPVMRRALPDAAEAAPAQAEAQMPEAVRQTPRQLSGRAGQRRSSLPWEHTSRPVFLSGRAERRGSFSWRAHRWAHQDFADLRGKQRTASGGHCFPAACGANREKSAVQRFSRKQGVFCVHTDDGAKAPLWQSRGFPEAPGETAERSQQQPAAAQPCMTAAVSRLARRLAARPEGVACQAPGDQAPGDLPGNREKMRRRAGLTGIGHAPPAGCRYPFIQAGDPPRQTARDAGEEEVRSACRCEGHRRRVYTGSQPPLRSGLGQRYSATFYE